LAVREVRYLDTIPVYVAQGAFSPRRNSDFIFRSQGLVKSTHVRSLHWVLLENVRPRDHVAAGPREVQQPTIAKGN
jgi:hypothetical protein